MCKRWGAKRECVCVRARAVVMRLSVWCVWGGRWGGDVGRGGDVC